MCVRERERERERESASWPPAAAAENICQMFSRQEMGGMVNEEELRMSLVGLCRDLRGIALAFHSRNTYMMLFDWMYPHLILSPSPHTHMMT